MPPELKLQTVPSQAPYNHNQDYSGFARQWVRLRPHENRRRPWGALERPACVLHPQHQPPLPHSSQLSPVASASLPVSPSAPSWPWPRTSAGAARVGSGRRPALPPLPYRRCGVPRVLRAAARFSLGEVCAGAEGSQQRPASLRWALHGGLRLATGRHVPALWLYIRTIFTSAAAMALGGGGQVQRAARAASAGSSGLLPRAPGRWPRAAPGHELLPGVPGSRRCPARPA